MPLTDSLWLDAIHAKARIQILPAEKQGREITSGVRLHASFGRKDLHLCQLRVEGADSAAPGTECDITLAFAAPRGLGNRLSPGTDFVLVVEMHTVANGKILEDLRRKSFLERLGF
ncbi:MAG: hypothetical protein IT452_18400 [Planctomycetia bacterium]|nr:hypothetical protein [Planctomycetia bacterium]